MEHGPSTKWGKDNAQGYKMRLGLWMFGLYLIVYAGFVLINSVWPHVMERNLGEMNMAVGYGFGLIVFALILALIYNFLSCRAEERFNDVYTDDEEEEF